MFIDEYEVNVMSSLPRFLSRYVSSMPLYPVGTRVAAQYKQRKAWFKGYITAAHVQPSGIFLYSVEYDDHDVEHRVAEKYLRHLDTESPQSKSRTSAASVVKQPGVRVLAQYQGGVKLFPGTIQGVDEENRTCDIRYDDGDVELGLPWHFIRPDDGKTIYQPQDKVVICAWGM